MEGSLLIDVSRLMGRASRGRLPTGVDRVCLAYVARFGQRAQAVLQWRAWRRILPYDASQQLFALLQNPGPGFFADAARVIARACLPPWPDQDGRGRIYFNHGHSGLDDAELAAWLQRTRQRPVFMVHDLIPLTHPEYCRPGERERHVARLQMMLGTAAGVLTNSEDTAQELRRFAQARQLALPPVQPAALAPAALPSPPKSAPPLAQPYFVVLGTIEPRKNHWLLLHLWRDLVAELGARAPHLVVVGQRGWECENVVDLLERCEGLRGYVHELPSCSDEDLAAYLTHARALLFPSFAEGYGMPLVEALMLGTPAIVSELPTFREIAGDVPDYLDPLDGRGWAEAIREYARDDSPRRAAQLQRMQGFETPTWDRHFERVEGLLEQLR
jgi:glycosyltransferase involved in cell wall biosynthesis